MDFTLDPPRSDEDLAAWVAAGQADGGAIEVLWHAAEAARRGWTEDDCPFEDPKARERWLHVVRPRRATALSRAGTKTVPLGDQWWMDL